MKISKLRKVAQGQEQPRSEDVVALLLKDHEAMRDLMAKVKSPRSTNARIRRAFSTLVKLVDSHMKAEEASLLTKIVDHPLFEDEAEEGYEEHRIHELVIANVRKLGSSARAIVQIKIFCEFLEHHLDEEEEDLFPRFKNYAATSTRKKIGARFLAKREATRRNKRPIGALKDAA